MWRRQPAGDGFLGSVGVRRPAVAPPGRRRAAGRWIRQMRLGPPGAAPFRPLAAAAARLRRARPPSIATEPAPTRCCAGEERRFTTGTDLALLLATGVGPLVLGRSGLGAGARAAARPTRRRRCGPDRCMCADDAQPVPAQFTQPAPAGAGRPRRPTPTDDPGPCGELARARRLEQVAISQSANAAARRLCPALRSRSHASPSRAQNTAAYLELAGAAGGGGRRGHRSVPAGHPRRRCARAGPRSTGSWAQRPWPAPGSSSITCRRSTRAIFSCDPLAAAAPAGTPDAMVSAAAGRWAAARACPEADSSAPASACPRTACPTCAKMPTRARSDRLIGCRAAVIVLLVSAAGRGARSASHPGRATRRRHHRPRRRPRRRLPPPAPGPRPRIAITELEPWPGKARPPRWPCSCRTGSSWRWCGRGSTCSIRPTSPSGWPAPPSCRDARPRPASSGLGELLGVLFVIRVKVDNDGNSYKMTARLFSTEGAAPAALPVAAQSRTCDVCTAQEAREQMIRLADGLRPRIEEHTALPPPPAQPRDDGPAVWPAWTAVGAGLLGVVVGALVLRSADSGGSQRRAALGGALMGAGLTTVAGGAACGDLGRPPRSPGPARPGPGPAVPTPEPSPATDMRHDRPLPPTRCGQLGREQKPIGLTV